VLGYVRASGGFTDGDHGGEFARLLIFDEIIAFDGIAAKSARS